MATKCNRTERIVLNTDAVGLCCCNVLLDSKSGTAPCHYLRLLITLCYINHLTFEIPSAAFGIPRHSMGFFDLLTCVFQSNVDGGYVWYVVC